MNCTIDDDDDDDGGGNDDYDMMMTLIIIIIIAVFKICVCKCCDWLTPFSCSTRLLSFLYHCVTQHLETC
jgi:uncharacterized membrane protein YkgB